MKVSIVIPVYNAEKYLGACIESCINQTYKDIEIIIVDDGSTDNSSDIIMKYFHLHPKLITPIVKSNGGTASALNIGIDNMKGEWFKWLSADDVLLPTAIENMLNMIEPLPHDQLFYTDYDIIDESSKIISSFKDREYLNQKPDLYNNFFGNGSTTLIHRRMFDVVGRFNTNMPFDEDYEFWLRWVLVFGLKMKYLPITTLRYRVHPDSLTSTKSLNEDKKVIKYLKAFHYPLLNSDEKEYLKLLKKKPLKKRIGIKFPILVRLFR